MAEPISQIEIAAADSRPRPALAGLALATFVAILGMAGPTSAPGQESKSPGEATQTEGAEAEKRAPAAQIDLFAALELAFSGPKPSEAEVSALEAELGRDPDDLATRL
ncbi:MAG: hypothetical protein MI919_20080, partial [Holophagales bacterium]|nr:hypothetical protein [Holophagales bacterium]